MAKWIKAKWYMSAAGGVSITAFYVYKEEERTDSRTRVTTRYRSATPVMTSIRPCQSEELHKESGIMLKPDEFMIQDVPYNTEDGVAQEGKISPLKSLLRSQRIMLDDYERECAILETEVKELYTNVVVQDEMIAIDMTPAGSTPDRERIKKQKVETLAKANAELSAEKKQKMQVLMGITSIKANKESIVKGLFDKGYETIEEVAGSSVEILMTVKGIGKVVAENILAELNVAEEIVE
jgi:hypothetical protein